MNPHAHMTKEEASDLSPTCPDCGHTLSDGHNDDSFECVCCDTLVNVTDAVLNHQIMNEKTKAMEAFKGMVAAIDGLPKSIVDAMNVHPGVWGSHNAVISQAKAGLMTHFGITTEEWNSHFEGWERFS